jgi:branched-chain amino acid transport system substrate-binding protein
MIIPRTLICALVPAVLALATLATSSASAQDIRLGLATAVTGPVAAIGAQSRLGTQAAIAVINMKGGVKGRKLVLQVEDDACEPKQAVTVANRLAASSIKLVLGHLCSSAAIAAADVYAERDMVMMTGSATNPALTDKAEGGTIFRVCGRDDQQGAVAGKMLAERWRDKRIALVSDKSAYGAGLVAEARKAMATAGVKATYEGAVNAGERDFGALVTRLKSEKIDVVYFGGYHTELALIIRQSHENGFAPVFVAGEAMASTEFWAIAREAANGTLFTYAPEVKTRPQAQEAVKAMQAIDTGADPDNFAFYYYAAVQALAEAIDKAGADTAQPVAKALRSGSFATIVGDLTFDRKGDLTAPEYVFYEWRDGKYARAF